MPFGIAAGFIMVTSLPTGLVQGLLGLFIVGYVVHAWREAVSNSKKDGKPTALPPDALITKKAGAAAEPPVVVRPGLLTAAAVGFGSALLTSAFSTGGPVLLIYASKAKWDLTPQRFRANLQIAFLVLNVMTITLYIWRGYVNVSSMHVTQELFPAALVGVALGNVAGGYVNRDQFRLLVYVGLGLMGLVYASKGVFYCMNEFGAPPVLPTTA